MRDTFGDIVEHAVGGGWGSDEPGATTEEVLVVRGADFPSLEVQSLEGVPVRHEEVSKLPQRVLREDDILLEISGGTKDRPTGRTVFITATVLNDARCPVIPASFCRLVRVDPAQASPRFVYYALQDLYAKGGTWEYQNQSTGLSNFQFRLFSNNYSLPEIELHDQRAISEVLGALDDKIAANVRLTVSINMLLEAQFEGFTRGAPTGMLAEIAEVNRITVTPAQGQIRYLDIASVGVGSYECPGLTDWSSAPGRARRGVSEGDTVWSTVRPNRRSHALVLEAGRNIVASTGLAVITPREADFAFVYEATRTGQFTAFLESIAEGSAYPAVKATRFGEAPVPLPSVERRREFEALAAPLRRRGHAAAMESRSLARTRDELLPLLMSGKVRVKNAEKVVEGVV